LYQGVCIAGVVRVCVKEFALGAAWHSFASRVLHWGQAEGRYTSFDQF